MLCSRKEAHEMALGVKKVEREGDLGLLGTKNLEALIRYWESQKHNAMTENQLLYREFNRVRGRDRERSEIAMSAKRLCAEFYGKIDRYIDVLKATLAKTHETIPYIPVWRPTTYLREGDRVDGLEGPAVVVGIDIGLTHRAGEGLTLNVSYRAEKLSSRVASSEMAAEDAEIAETSVVPEAFEFPLREEGVFREDEWQFLKTHRDAKYLILSGFLDEEKKQAVKEKLRV